MTALDRPQRALFLYLGALLLIASAFGQAAWDALATGKVTVLQVGKYGTTTETVPWPQGWSRFAGPLVLLAALETWRRRQRFWTALVLAAAGLVLISCSIWFTSVQRVLAFAGWNAILFASLAIGNRFGRFAAFAFLGTCLLVALALQGHA